MQKKASLVRVAIACSLLCLCWVCLVFFWGMSLDCVYDTARDVFRIETAIGSTAKYGALENQRDEAGHAADEALGDGKRHRGPRLNFER